MAHIKTVWKHLRRSPYQALAAILILSLTFFLSAIFVLLALGSSVILSYFLERPQISVFFKDEATQDQIESIKNELFQTGQIAQIRFVSKEEALSIYREQNKDDPALVDLVTADILPASLEISAKDARNLVSIAEILKGRSEIEEIIFQKDVVERLSLWINGLRIVGGVLVGFLILVSLAQILTITAMRIASRKEEISIMQLIGASSWYIRWPFILEGLVYGLSGSILGTGIVYLLFFANRPFLEGFFSGLPFFPLSPLVLIIVFFAQIAAGAVLGSLGSFLAVFRYLR